MQTIEIYTARHCPYCTAAKALLKRKAVPFTEIDIAANWERRDEMIDRANGHATVPQIFIGPTHVGGNDELHAHGQAGRPAAGRRTGILRAGAIRPRCDVGR
jgi:glutaredoxin 3